MAYNYIVTANRASSVNQSLTGNFTGPEDINLITAKLSRIEISKITPDGLKPVREIGVYGRIEALKLFRPPGYKKDLLFMLTHKYHVAVLECVEGPQPDTIDIITIKSGNIADPASRPAETGNIVIIDPACKMIGLRLYDGLFKVIPIDKNKSSEIEAFNIRMEEIVVPDITFLHGFQNPTIGFIFKDHSGTSHVKTYEVSLKEKEFILGPWSKENVANEANIIIPVPQPFGGAIVVALESIVYINGEKERVIAPPLIKQSPITCYARIDKDGSRYLLGDLSGRLFCLILEASDYRPSDSELEVKDMRLEFLGETSIPQCITYLDNAVVFVGSKLGDSQLIRLTTEPDEDGFFIQICESYTNLGPISDMCLVDLEKQGQGQLVTCSGYLKDGSLRIIRNGIGINEHASMDLPGIKGVWSLKIGKDQIKDNYLLITFIEDSFLWLCEDEGDFDNNIDEDGFDRKKRTVLCANVAHDQIVQVTRDSIRLISSITKQLVAAWQLPTDNGIYKVNNNQDNVVCADGKKLYFFEIKPGSLNLVKETVMEAEIACFDITPLSSSNYLLSVGFWFNMNIVIYGLPDIKELYRELLPSDMIPRSIITAKFEDSYYLLCALGDGSVYYFNLNPMTGCLTNCKKVTLGTYETILRPFKSQSTTSIFACSDRPTVIYSSNNKLVFSNVNLKEVNYMCSLDTNCYSDSLALVSDSDILFGTIDEIQKLHIRTIPLYESPVKIAHQQSTQTFGLLSMRKDNQEENGLQPQRQSASTQAHSKSSALAMSTGPGKPAGIACSDLLQEVETSNFLVINQHTFEVLHAHQFMPSEQAVTILSSRLGETNEEYFIVGTTFVNNDEPEPKQGRLIVFKWIPDANLQQVAELPIKGCPYSLCEFVDGKFLVGVNASVNLVELNSRRDLHIECTYVNATMALYLKRKGHLILLGDLMRSMSLFSYKPLQAHFEEIARDFNPAWMTEVEILDEDTFLGAEHQFNIFVCQRDSKANNDQDRQQMQQVGLFHLGDSVNVFHPGSLVVQHPSESSVEVKRTTLYGTVDGVVGLILSIDEALYKKLESIQNSLCRVVKSVGKIDHKEWRAFQGSKSSQPAMGFIDGDLVETFLDLSRDKMDQVARDADLSVDDLVKMIEELSRLH